ncbi:MAG: hypothetical protein K2X86_06380 [Cytophagaceae bacterium]|nr:hypothetical protein [Cytophagaceae bacterium]
MKKAILFLFFLSAIQAYAQDSRLAFHLYGGGSLSLIQDNLYYENVNVTDYSVLPKGSFTENFRIYTRLARNIHFILGYGHSRTGHSGATPAFFLPDDSLLFFKSGVNFISDFTYAGDFGFNFKLLEKPKWNINTSIAFSIGESRVDIRGNKQYIKFGNTVYLDSASYNGTSIYGTKSLYVPYKALKFSIGAEYKIGKAKTSAVTFDFFFNQGLNKLGWAIADARIDNRYIRTTMVNKGSYLALTLGFKKYFQVRPILNN